MCSIISCPSDKDQIDCGHHNFRENHKLFENTKWDSFSVLTAWTMFSSLGTRGGDISQSDYSGVYHPREADVTVVVGQMGIF